MDVEDPLYARLFARAPIYDIVFSCLSPRSLIRLARTCRAAYLAAGEFKTRAFNVNRHFSHYFTDPLAFRSLQARTNTLVSGSNALQFLDRSFYPDSDLDLYTHPGHSFEVAQFLVVSEGYVYAPRSSQESDWKVAIGRDWDGTQRRSGLALDDSDHGYPMLGIRSVWSFTRTDIDQQCLTVQIIEGRSSPLESILGFHSTCVMNFISSNAAYSIYPIATFENRATLGMPPSRSSAKALQKYAKRGWRIYFVPAPHDSAFFLNKARWISDKHTWRLPLDQTGVKERLPLSPTSAPLTRDPVLFNGWKLRPLNGDELCGYECHYYPLRTTLFRYNYTLSDERLSYTIRAWAQRQGQFCHVHISKEDWAWFDADIPGFLQKK